MFQFLSAADGYRYSNHDDHIKIKTGIFLTILEVVVYCTCKSYLTKTRLLKSNNYSTCLLSSTTLKVVPRKGEGVSHIRAPTIIHCIQGTCQALSSKICLQKTEFFSKDLKLDSKCDRAHALTQAVPIVTANQVKQQLPPTEVSITEYLPKQSKKYVWLQVVQIYCLF